MNKDNQASNDAAGPLIYLRSSKNLYCGYTFDGSVGAVQYKWLRPATSTFAAFVHPQDKECFVRYRIGAVNPPNRSLSQQATMRHLFNPLLARFWHN